MDPTSRILGLTLVEHFQADAFSRFFQGLVLSQTLEERWDHLRTSAKDACAQMGGSVFLRRIGPSKMASALLLVSL